MRRAPYAVREVAAACTVLAVALMVLAPHYGPQRDELDFVAAAQHLA
jgi:hypothetical protein